jgi:hypothetical protein
MYATDKCIALAGSREKGRFALFISKDLYKGTCNVTESYENEILSKNSEFRCKNIEVWALTD